MQFKVYTYGLPQTIVLSLNANSDVNVRGFDPDRANTDYFNQEIDNAAIKALKGNIEINCPLVPDQYMLVELTGDAQLLKIGAKPLPIRKLYLAPDDEAYLHCNEWFSLWCGSKPPGDYQHDNIVFEYFNVIADNGVPQQTPARMDHVTGIPQIAKSYFDNYAVPMRVFILEHEWVHFKKNTINEQEADENALNICLSRGYPKMEMIYAATKIFGDDAQSQARVNAMVNFINNW